MKKIVQLIFLTGVLITLAQCGGAQNEEPEPEPEPVPEDVCETWQLIYDDYHLATYKDHPESCPSKYRYITRYVKVIRKRDEISIKGIFTKYPDAWTHFAIKNDSLYFTYQPVLEVSKDSTVYLHFGSLQYDDYYMRNDNCWTSTLQFWTTDKLHYHSILSLSYDGDLITANKARGGYPATFWYDNNNEGKMILNYFSDGNNPNNPKNISYPEDAGYMINMIFRKVSDGTN